MNNRHPCPLKKSKSWGPFWSYQLNSTANPAHLPKNWAIWAELAVLLAGSSKMAPRILIFSIAVVADYLFYVKSIATYAPTFFGYNHSIIAIVGHLCIGIRWMYRKLLLCLNTHLLSHNGWCTVRINNAVLGVLIIFFLEELSATPYW